MDKIFPELGTFEEFATAVLQTVAILAKRCLTSHDHFLVQSALLGWLWWLPAAKALRR